MKTYANFLYLGNLLAQCPEDNPIIFGAYRRLFKPNVAIVEEDCGTKVGESRPLIPTSNRSVGYIELDNSDTPVTPVRIQTLLANTDLTKLRVRVVSACTSEGGICRKCLWGSYRYLDPLFERNTIVNVWNYPDLSTVPPTGDSIAFDFTGVDSAYFLSELANGYVGSLLGMKSYLLERLPLRASLLRSFLPEPIVAMVQREITDGGLVPQASLDYATRLDDTLERTLYLLSQYVVGYYTSQA